MKKVTVLLGLFYLFALTGCNTVEGMGKDIQRGGQEIQDTAKDAQDHR